MVAERRDDVKPDCVDSIRPGPPGHWEAMASGT